MIYHDCFLLIEKTFYRIHVEKTLVKTYMDWKNLSWKKIDLIAYSTVGLIFLSLFMEHVFDRRVGLVLNAIALVLVPIYAILAFKKMESAE